MVTIRELRARNRMTQVELAKEIGVNKNSITRWENDITTISGENLIKVAKFFNVTTDSLLGLKRGDNIE